MPCYDSRDSDDLMRLRNMEARLDITTRLACEYLRSIEAAGEEIPAYARRWWTKHKLEDAKRGGR